MSLPIFPLNAVLFPGIAMQLRIFEERYLRMLRDRVVNDPIFGIALITAGLDTNEQPGFHRTGTAARLVSIDVVNDGLVEIVVVGDRRIRMSEGDWRRGYAVADTDYLPDRVFDRHQATIQLGRTRASYDSYVAGLAKALGKQANPATIPLDPGSGSYEIASRLPLDLWDQQAILEDRDPLSRLRRVSEALTREIGLLRRGMIGMPVLRPGTNLSPN